MDSTIKPPKMKMEPTNHAQTFCWKGNWAAARFAAIAPNKAIAPPAIQ